MKKTQGRTQGCGKTRLYTDMVVKEIMTRDYVVSVHVEYKNGGERTFIK